MFLDKNMLPSNFGSQTGFCYFLLELKIPQQTVNRLLKYSVELHQLCSFYFNISNQNWNWVAKITKMSEL